MNPTYLRPSFFIIGANKCGTSSLYRYLVAHPGVLPCAKKEPNFFGRHSPDDIARHLEDYFALFPTQQYGGPLTFQWEASDEAGAAGLTTVVVERQPGRRYITGEASANTFHEVSPSLLHHYLPDIKLIVLVRNPVDRAFSHHRMYRRFQAAGNELGFEVGSFDRDIRAELAAHERGERTHYIAPGIYIELLHAWLAEYGANQIKVLVTEELIYPRTAAHVMRQLEDYLGLPGHDYANILTRRFNHASPADMAPSVRTVLAEFYRPYNDRLEAFLGRKLNWQ
jgi:hypothetical protein